MIQSVLFKDLLACMRKSPNQRTQDDVTTIKQYLKEIAFLRDSFQSAEQSFDLLSKVFRLEIFDSDQTIFHIDSKGEKYYLILQGSVGIYIRPPKMNNQTIKQKKKKKSNDQHNSIKHDKEEGVEEWENRTNKHLEQLTMVKQLQEGQTFGEMALIYNKPRLATIHTLSQTVLAVLTKRDFRLIMKKAEMNLIKGELKFLKQVYLFQSWSYEMLRDIYLNSEQIFIQYGHSVFKEEDNSDSVYIIKRGSFQIGLMGECDVFGEEEFAYLVNQMFKEDKTNQQNQYFDISDKVLEQFISKYQSSNRYYTVTCESREGGSLVRIKVNDFIVRVLNYSQTRKLVLESIEKKIALHSLMHFKNCQTFVVYQQYLLKEDANRNKNQNTLVCPNTIYLKNDRGSDTHSGIQANNSPQQGISRDNPLTDSSSPWRIDTQMRVTKQFRQNSASYNSRRGWENQNNTQKTFNSQGKQKSNHQKIPSANNISEFEQVGDAQIDKTNTNNTKQPQQSINNKSNHKSYKFHFTTDSCDNSIFQEKIPQNIKIIQKERQKQKQEMLMIQKFEQTKLEKAQLAHFQNKYNQQNSQQVPKSPNNNNSNGLEPYILNKIEKLGYKLVPPKEVKVLKERIDNFPIAELVQNIYSPKSENNENPMLITSCGEAWINHLKSLEREQTDLPVYPYHSFQQTLQKNSEQPTQRRKSPQRDKGIRLKPLTIINQGEISQNEKQTNRVDFDNFYNGIGQCNNQLNNTMKPQNMLTSPKTKIIYHHLSHSKQFRNKSQDVYHPLNYYQKSQNTSPKSTKDNPNKNNTSSSLVKQMLNDYRERSLPSHQNQILNCSQINPPKSDKVCKTTNGSDRYFFNINKNNKINNRSLLKRVILDSL